ncbi:MAG: SulP family inorganic anion transporter, partial [Gammaproteobacteria bacterium]
MTASAHPTDHHGAGFGTADLVAGVTVALVLIPQAIAYAALAGLPPVYGIYAAALPPMAAAFFASSPYLQTGPVAVTSVLTLGALSVLAQPFSEH